MTHYQTDPTDRDAPLLLDEYKGIKPGDKVTHHAPVAPLTGPLTVDAIYQFTDNGHGGWVTAILNDGEYEVSADHLRVAEMEDR